MAQRFKLFEEHDGAIYILPLVAGEEDSTAGTFADVKRQAIAMNRARIRPFMAAIRCAKNLKSKKAARADYTRPLPLEG